MLTLLCFRSEETGRQAVSPGPARSSGSTRVVARSPLEPMTDDEAQALIGGSASRRAPRSRDEDRLRLTREAGGSPFVLEQLARYAARSPTARRPSRPRFAAMFDARLDCASGRSARLPRDAGVCGRPMAPEVALRRMRRSRATAVARGDASRPSHFIRSSGSSDRVETYHDRIREVLAGRLAPDDVRADPRPHGGVARRATERRLRGAVRALSRRRRSGRAAARRGSPPRKPARRSRSTARRPSIRHALELSPSSAERPRVERRARDRARQRRPPGRSRRCISATPRRTADHARQVELQRRAAEQFLIGGHIDRGLDLIRRVLASVGLTCRAQPPHAVVRLLWRRATAPLARACSSCPAAGRRAIDAETCSSASTRAGRRRPGSGSVDIISASDFIAQHLHMALDAGEPSRIARGLAIESAARHADWPFRKGSARLCRTVGGRRQERRHAAGTRDGAPRRQHRGAPPLGEWKRALESSERALAILRDRCVGLTWEMNIAQNIVIWALMYLGELGEVSAPCSGAAGRRAAPRQPVSRDRAVHPQQLRVARRRRPRRRGA